MVLLLSFFVHQNFSTATTTTTTIATTPPTSKFYFPTYTTVTTTATATNATFPLLSGSRNGGKKWHPIENFPQPKQQS